MMGAIVTMALSARFPRQFRFHVILLFSIKAICYMHMLKDTILKILPDFFSLHFVFLLSPSSSPIQAAAHVAAL